MVKVLVVDDEEGIRKLLSDALKRALCEVCCVGSGPEALAAMRRQSFDVIISDLVMIQNPSVGTISELKRRLVSPEREGLETINRIKAMNPSAKIIAISGSLPERADEFLDEAKELGVSCVFKKPFGIRALTKAVMDLAGESTNTLQVKRKDFD